MNVPVGKVAIAAVGAGALAARWLQGRATQAAGQPAAGEARSRWRSVTINRGADEVMPGGQAPAPLADLGDLVEVRVRPAPGGRGTELSARLRDGEPAGVGGTVARLTGDDPRQRVRSALREAKQLIEVGEVLRVEPAPHGPRRTTPAGKLVELATRRAPGEGVL